MTIPLYCGYTYLAWNQSAGAGMDVWDKFGGVVESDGKRVSYCTPTEHNYAYGYNYVGAREFWRDASLYYDTLTLLELIAYVE